MMAKRLIICGLLAVLLVGVGAIYIRALYAPLILDDVSELAKLPAEWFHFGHLCDAPGEIPSDRDEMTRILREERSYVGEGGIDVAAIMNAMPAMPYSIELPNLKKVAEYGYKEHAQRCLETARTYCAGRVTGRKG